MISFFKFIDNESIPNSVQDVNVETNKPDDHSNENTLISHKAMSSSFTNEPTIVKIQDGNNFFNS